jgi:hypothetical protein
MAWTLAEIVGHEAGWIIGEKSDPDIGGQIEFHRYVGVDNPDGELQAAHYAHLEDSLQARGFDQIERVANGIVISGQVEPTRAVALLAAASSGRGRTEFLDSNTQRIEEADFLGTCFAFRHSNIYLAAAHCVQAVQPGMLFLNCPPAGNSLEVVQVHVHPTADLAILKLGDGVWPGGVEPFVGFADSPELGAQFMAYGFPEDLTSLDASESKPTERMFRGSFQRTLDYERGAYKYRAGEMSIPSPAGLSGGPLFSAVSFNSVIAVATENVQSATYVGRFEETVIDGVTVRQIERDMVQYGIATLLAPLAQWLAELVPPCARMPPVL